MLNIRNVVITGAASGIGLATSRYFVDTEMFNVFGIDKLECSDDILMNSDNYFHLVADVRGKLPNIDNVNILINDAGIQSDFDNSEDIDVNLKGLINVTNKYGLQPDIQAIVNVASVSAHTGAEFPEYSASKGGVLSYTKSIANEVAQYHATCNSISPGGVLTKLNQPVIDDKEKWLAIMDETLLRKWASAREIAEWIFFIAVINESMTGQDVIVDNGEMVKSHFVW